MIEFDATRQTTVTNPPKSVRVHVHWLMKVIFVCGVILFPALSYEDWRQGDPIASVAFGVFTLLSLWTFFLADSTIDADQQGIRLTAPHGVYELRWPEMKSVKIRGSAIRLFGDNKALAYNLLLAGKGKREFQEYVAHSIQERRMAIGEPPGMNALKLRQMCRNAKVRGWKLF
jgi:hypothetical protein